MHTLRLLFLVAAALPLWGQAPSFHHDTFHGRQAYVLENGEIRVSALRGGGHLAEIRFLSGDPKKSINPMRVPHYQTIEPYQYDPAQHDALYGSDSHRWLSSGYMGHLLCFPAFGPPSSDEEVRNQLGNHGEAPIVEWKERKVEVRQDGVTLWYGADLPKTQYRVERAVTLRAGEPVVRVEEWVENLALYDRPINWVQHATFGPPFAVPGQNFLDVPATKGQVGGGRTGNSLASGAEIQWPEGASREGKRVDLRVFQPAPHSGTYYALRLDPARADSYFTMYNPDFPILIGYIFPTADNPWIGDWQENQSVKQRPWDGKTVARGLEFGTSPMPEGLRRSVNRGTMLGAPTFRWIGGCQRLKTTFTIFLAEIPVGFAGVEDVRAEAGRIVVRERGTGKVIELGRAKSPSPVFQEDERRGIVVLQFDDGTVGHYTNVFPLLQECGLQGSFGVVTGVLGRPGRLTDEQVAAMHAAGHEIHDHTLYHRARFWGEHHKDDAVRVPQEWEAEIQESLSILAKLGIVTRGWNQPGGQGQWWTLALHTVLAKHYDYVAGRVDLPQEQRYNFHWNMRDDPLSAGYGVGSTSSGPTQIIQQIADGVARGLVCVPLYHVIEGQEISRLEQVCRFVSANGIRNLRMVDAVAAVRNTPRHVHPLGNQMPNSRFTYDLDKNGRPDGWEGCEYAPVTVKARVAGAKALQINSGSAAETILYGPETGASELQVELRAPAGQRASVKVEIDSLNLSEQLQSSGSQEGLYSYTRQRLVSPAAWRVGDRWSRKTHRLSVPQRSDRLILRFSASGAVYVAYPTWRKSRR
jgi:peptidoglycan/xylan/chitin deacetylase (PgdA/CDA1 family)